MSGQSRMFTPGVVLGLLAFVVLFPLLPLIVSGQWDWLQAWVYALWSMIGFVVSRALVARRYPDLLTERFRFTEHADAKPWDRALAPLVLVCMAAALVVAGLDARFGWSPPLSLAVQAAALAALVGGWLLGTYALLENRFFSGVVRIQRERGHHVVSTGPYRWVRHPGYAGTLIFGLATPFWLESLWAILPTIAVCAVLVVRTRLEDATLREELDGYHEYAGCVRYRLVPGVW